MADIAAAPPKFDSWPLQSGTLLQRVAMDHRGATEFSDWAGPTRRFGPVRLAGGDCLATLYAASTIHAAIMEVPFHDVDLTVAEPKAFLSNLLAMRRSEIITRRNMQLADVTDSALTRYGVKRVEIVDTGPKRYGETSRWAVVAFERGFDGIVWNSRRHPVSQAFVLFAGRVDRMRDLDIATPPRPLAEGAGYEEVIEVATEAGITLIQ